MSMMASLLFLVTLLLPGAIPIQKIPFTMDVMVPAAIDGSSIDYQFFVDGDDTPEPCLALHKVLNPQSPHSQIELHLMCKLEPGKHVGFLRFKIYGYDPFTVNVTGIDVGGLRVNYTIGVINAPQHKTAQVPIQATAEPVETDVPLETSQVLVQARVSSEPVKMRANEHPEGILHIDVAATDGKGKPVSGLTAKDFTLTDNGVPQKIVSFAAANPTLLQSERLSEVAVVLDEVDLLPNQLELMENESIKFLRGNGGHLAEPTSVYWFTMSGLYATDLTTDGNALAEDVAHHTSRRKVLAVSQSYDPFVDRAESERLARWNASVRAVYAMTIERRSKPGRKLLLWIGFGWLAIHGNQRYKEHYKDDAFPWLVELSTRIREARMVISEVTVRTQPDGSVVRREPSAYEFKNSYKDYLAGVRTPSELEAQGFGPSSHFALPVLAMQSGGLVVDEFLGISRSIEHCVEDARTFFTLSFDPPLAAHPDEYHDLAVKIAAPGLYGRTNSGYYDQPVYYDQPPMPARHVSVGGLEQVLENPNDKSDDELAKELASLELSERLSSNRLTLWKNRLHGKKSIMALVTLADESVFLDPPAAEIPSDPAPDREAQRKMILKTAKYLKEVNPQLPDFFATRITTEYEQPSAQKKDSWKTALADQSLREAVISRVILRYRNGHEEEDAEKRESNPSARKRDLKLVGVFSPVLGAVLGDTTRSGSILTWSHWELGQRGREAVFRYLVRSEDPHYNVAYCCLTEERGFRGSPRYLGKLTIDPETGAILRLTMQAELEQLPEPNLSSVMPAKGAATMIEYGPVEIGGREYICPHRAVEIMRVRTISSVDVLGQKFDVYAPYETRLNDIVYTNYHKFGASARMLPGYSVVPDAAPAVNGQTSTPPSR
jgi:VWFA-related protein